MTVVPAALLSLAAVIGVLPAVVAALAHGAAVFTDPARYAATVLSLPNAATAGRPAPAADWTTTGVLLGLLSTCIAVVLATAAVHQRTPELSAHQPVARAVRTLRRLHSGRIGDYLAWLTLGIAALCIAIASQT
ncbi:hypothetical protein ACFXB3_02940 [Streptomyces sp. NPDC059447]|uniref:hypothetical protein n=1 Tax=Streptomyces sp. NPDC059447 TaxID=3346834 RepID=UPI00367D50D3